MSACRQCGARSGQRCRHRGGEPLTHAERVAYWQGVKDRNEQWLAEHPDDHPDVPAVKGWIVHAEKAVERLNAAVAS